MVIDLNYRGTFLRLCHTLVQQFPDTGVKKPTGTHKAQFFRTLILHTMKSFQLKRNWLLCFTCAPWYNLLPLAARLQHHWPYLISSITPGTSVFAASAHTSVLWMLWFQFKYRLQLLFCSCQNSSTWKYLSLREYHQEESLNSMGWKGP